MKRLSDKEIGEGDDCEEYNDFSQSELAKMSKGTQDITKIVNHYTKSLLAMNSGGFDFENCYKSLSFDFDDNFKEMQKKFDLDFEKFKMDSKTKSLIEDVEEKTEEAKEKPKKFSHDYEYTSTGGSKIKGKASGSSYSSSGKLGKNGYYKTSGSSYTRHESSGDLSDFKSMLKKHENMMKDIESGHMMHSHMFFRALAAKKNKRKLSDDMFGSSMFPTMPGMGDHMKFH